MLSTRVVTIELSQAVSSCAHPQLPIAIIHLPRRTTQFGSRTLFHFKLSKIKGKLQVGKG